VGRARTVNSRPFVSASLTFYIEKVSDASPGCCDDHGALVVVKTERGVIILIHPLGASDGAPASLPSEPFREGEDYLRQRQVD